MLTYLLIYLLENKPKCDKRSDIQQDDPDFINAHAGIVEFVECLSREVEPSAMKAVYPVVGKAEHAKPDQKYRIVKGQTVKQNLFEGIGVHGGISLKRYLPCYKDLS